MWKGPHISVSFSSEAIAVLWVKMEEMAEGDNHFEVYEEHLPSILFNRSLPSRKLVYQNLTALGFAVA